MSTTHKWSDEEVHGAAAALERQRDEANKEVLSLRAEVSRLTGERDEYAVGQKQARAQRDAAERELDLARKDHADALPVLNGTSRKEWERAEQIRVERDAALAKVAAIAERDEAREVHLNYITKHHEYVHPDVHDAALTKVAELEEWRTEAIAGDGALVRQCVALQAQVSALRGVAGDVLQAVRELDSCPGNLGARLSDMRALLASPDAEVKGEERCSHGFNLYGGDCQMHGCPKHDPAPSVVNARKLRAFLGDKHPGTALLEEVERLRAERKEWVVDVLERKHGALLSAARKAKEEVESAQCMCSVEGRECGRCVALSALDAALGESR